MSKAILTCPPCIEILIIVNELLILVIRVVTISFIAANFVTHKKSIDKIMLHIERSFLLFKF